VGPLVSLLRCKACPCWVVEYSYSKSKPDTRRRLQAYHKANHRSSLSLIDLRWPNSEMLAAFALSTVARAAGSEVTLRSTGGAATAITYNGEVLDVPQQCRSTACDSLASFDAKQATANAMFAGDIDSLSRTAATTSGAIGAAAAALTEQDGRNALKFENGVATLSAQNLAVRRAFLAADEALERAQQAETDARIASYQVAADRMDADTASLASKDAKLQEVLLATIARLDALERTQRTDVSELKAADRTDQTVLNALTEASENADAALEKATATLAEKHRKENLALVAADVALAKADKAAADAHASTHQALEQADKDLAQRLADLKANHDAEVAALRKQDSKLTAEDSLVAERAANLRLAMEAADALLRTKINAFGKQHFEQVKLLRIEDSDLDDAHATDKSNLANLAIKVDKADEKLAEQLKRLRAEHGSSITDLKAMDAKLQGQDKATMALSSAYYLQQAADLTNLKVQVKQASDMHTKDYDAALLETASLKLEDKSIARSTSTYGTVFGLRIAALRTQHEADVAELLEADKALRTADAAGVQRAKELDLALTMANTDLSGKIRDAAAAYDAAMGELRLDDNKRASATATDIDALAKKVLDAQRTLGATITAAQTTHNDDVKTLRATDASTLTAMTATSVRVGSIGVAIAAQDAVLLQKIAAARTQHAAKVALLQKKDEQLVKDMASAQHAAANAQDDAADSVNTQLGNARIALTAQLKSATDDRAAIRMEIAAADGIIASSIAQLTVDHTAAVDALEKKQSALESTIAELRRTTGEADASIDNKIASANNRLDALALSYASTDSDLAASIRQARADYDAEVARALKAEQTNAAAIVAAGTAASDANDALESTLTTSIAKLDGGIKAREGTLALKLSNAVSTLATRIKAAENEHTKQLGLTRSTEADLVWEDELTNIKANELKLHLASEDSKLVTLIGAQESSRKISLELFRLSDEALAGKDRAALTSLNELQKTHADDVVALKKAASKASSYLSDLKVRTAAIDEDLRAKITDAEEKAERDNEGSQAQFKTVLAFAEANSESRDIALSKTAGANAAAARAQHALLKAAAREADEAISLTAAENKRSAASFLESSKTSATTAANALNSASKARDDLIEEAMETADADLLSRIKKAASNLSDMVDGEALYADDSRASLLATLRSEASLTKNLLLAADAKLRTDIASVKAAHDAAVKRLDAEDATLQRKMDTERDEASAHTSDAKGVVDSAIASQRAAALAREAQIKELIAAEDAKLAARLLQLENKHAANVTDLQDKAKALEQKIAANKAESARLESDLRQSTEERVASLEEQRKGADGALKRDLGKSIDALRTKEDALREHMVDAVATEKATREGADGRLRDSILESAGAARADAGQLRADAASDLADATATRQSTDNALSQLAQTKAKQLESETLENDAAIRALLVKKEEELQASILEAERQHARDVAELQEQDERIDQSILPAVAAAEQKVVEAGEAWTDKLNADVAAKSAADAAADAAEVDAVHDVSRTHSKMVAGTDSSTSACSSNTRGDKISDASSHGKFGVCNLRDERHGGVAGHCDPTGAVGGWCSFRCNNGEWRGENACKHVPVNGDWSMWGKLGACSVTECGTNGFRTKTRTCTDPAPAFGGAECAGKDSDSSFACATAVCEGTFSITGTGPGEAWRTCPVGFGMTKQGTASTDRECKPCAVGAFFSTTNDGSQCESVRKPCPAGQYVLAAATASSNLVCRANPGNTFTSSEGQLTFTAWRTCPVGFGMTKQGTASSDRECEPCAAGAFFSTTNGDTRCESVRKPCPAGEHVLAAATASSDLECRPCGADAFSAESGAAKCEEWRTCAVGSGMTTQGTASSDRVCGPCKLGFSSSGANDGASCETTAECTGNEYETVAATLSSDRTCATHARECATHEYESQAPGPQQDRQCKQKVCHCPNGRNAVGDACPKHGNPKCVSCVGAYHLANGNDQCDANMCRCTHGAVATGADCTVHGATKCNTCNGGYIWANGDCINAPVHCSGSWSDPGCSPSCNGVCTSTQTYSVARNLQYGGRTCEAANGATRPGTSHSGAPCAEPCVGHWADSGCTPACGSQCTTTMKYTVDRELQHGGLACEAANGATKAGTTHHGGACPTNGNWGSYNAWTSCSAKCGGGTQSRYRQCNNPAPAHGGAGCAGSPTMWQSCNPTACCAGPHYGFKGGVCRKSCGALGGPSARSFNSGSCEQRCMGSAGTAYDVPLCCVPNGRPAPHYGQKNGRCMGSCGAIGGTSSFHDSCANHGKGPAPGGEMNAYDVPHCCR